jgi:hypothetical protein
MYNTYCKILGVKPNSSTAELKRAYRQKAKLLHPDINPSPDAHSEFIKTKQAFEFIQKYRTCQALYRRRMSYYREKARTSPQYKSYYYREQTKYRMSRENAWRIYNSRKYKVNFLATLFGKIIFFVFHIMFLFIGFYILIYPLIHTIRYGVDQDKTLIGTIITIMCAMLFGSVMIFMIAISGLSYNSSK